MEPEENHQGLDTLVAWQKAREVMLFVHKQVAPTLPTDEKWDLTSQIQRASKSVMANIAEGYGRFYYQETIRFCYIARGSLVETYNHLVTALDLNYISRSLYDEGVALIEATHRTLNGYIAYLKRNKRGGELPGGRLQEAALTYEWEPENDAPFPNPELPFPNP
jgi:four helix bundle protein